MTVEGMVGIHKARLAILNPAYRLLGVALSATTKAQAGAWALSPLWSGGEDLNLRPLRPERSALPS